MKTFNKKRLLGLALSGGMCLLGTQSAFAAAGDSIANKATLNYSVSGASQELIESSPSGNSTPGVTNGADTTFIEDRVINFSVTRGGTTGTAVPNGTLQAVQYTIQNDGNGPQGFLLKGLNNPDTTVDPFGGNADDWDATSVQTFVEDGTTPGFQTGEDTAAFVATLAAGASVDVYVVSTIPLVDSTANPLATGDVAVMTLLAQVAIPGSTGIAADAIVADDNGNTSPAVNGYTNGSENVSAGVANSIADDPATEQTVFNDPAGAGAVPLDAVKDGQNSDDSSYTIQTAELTVTKTSSALWDFVNGGVNSAHDPKSIPGGSIIRYTISIANGAGAADATLTDISDTLTLAIDNQFGDGTDANAPVSGANNVRVTDGAGSVAFCLADGSNADGCINNGGGGSDLVVDLTAVAGITNVLQAGETLTIEFDVVLP